MEHQHGLRARLRYCALSILTIAALATMASDASASSPLEGVWSFNGGQIAVHSDGGEEGLVGTVIAATTFADCSHQVGENIWTQIEQQPDGSFYGLHQWFYEDGSCTPNPVLGPTAFRVMSGSGGRYLRVCLSEPGTEEQPTIAGDGKATGVTFGCVDSELIAGLSRRSELTASNLIGLRGAEACLGDRSMRIPIRGLSGDSIVKTTVTVREGGVVRHAKVVKRGKGEIAIIHPAAVPGGHFVVTVTLKTALGHTIKTKRTYRRCGRARRVHSAGRHRNG